MLATERNTTGLSERQMEYCQEAWTTLCGEGRIPLNTSSAQENCSRTRFREDDETVFLGADAYPGVGANANTRMSTLACLAHEFAHAVRFQAGYRRPFDLPDVLIDEAETSLRASFESILSTKDREDLVEDARDRLIHWLSTRHEKGVDDES